LGATFFLEAPDPEEDDDEEAAPVLEGGIWGGWKMSIREASAKSGTAEAVRWGRCFFFWPPEDPVLTGLMALWGMFRIRGWAWMPSARETIDC